MSAVLQKHIICVGAVYIDTILTVPHFPIEDEKLRAKNITRRRGGNTANTLEVLTQLLEHDPARSTRCASTRLHLLSVLPDEASDAAQFVRESLPVVDVNEASIFREGHTEAASSYIIQSQQNLSRTIVSINELPEMRVEEFIAKAESNSDIWKQGWFHFEGRIPEVTLRCVQYLRSERGFQDARISVECEKPERTGMSAVAELADVVFYSKIWAKRNGCEDARSFLESQLENTKDGAMLCCTWGAGGATVVQKTENEDLWADVQAWQPPQEEGREVVDTIGAGDTFIAGMLFALNNHADDWLVQRKLEFANQLAGRKVLQEGFDGLGGKMR